MKLTGILLLFMDYIVPLVWMADYKYKHKVFVPENLHSTRWVSLEIIKWHNKQVGGYLLFFLVIKHHHITDRNLTNFHCYKANTSLRNGYHYKKISGNWRQWWAQRVEYGIDNQHWLDLRLFILDAVVFICNVLSYQGMIDSSLKSCSNFPTLEF